MTASTPGFAGDAILRPRPKRKMRRWKKIVLIVVAVVVGLPVSIMAAFAALVWAANGHNGSVVSSGETRTYLLHVPPGYDAKRPTPLLISMHPAAFGPTAQMKITKWNEFADRHNFIVVYPSGGRGGFPIAWTMGPHTGANQDAKFISDLIDKLEAAYNIDARRIYADGLSNGGGMAFVLACRLPQRVAAVAAVAAAQTLPWEWCTETAPVPMLAIHGTADPVVPFKSSRSRDPFNPVMFPDVREWTAKWARRNQCGSEPSDTPVGASVHRIAYTNCADNADVVLYQVNGGGHTWPGGTFLPQWLLGPTTRDIDAREAIWDFFVQHPLPARS